jgi:hypothetical protein
MRKPSPHRSRWFESLKLLKMQEMKEMLQARWRWLKAA